MGLRGPGAARLKKAREAAAVTNRKLPWERKGLTRVQRVIRFLEFLPITKGHLVGKTLKLLPEQREFVTEVYGRANRKRRRLIRLAVKSEPRGNGKTGLIAGLALCHLVGPEAEPRGEVYSAAIDRQQAGIMFNEMEAVLVAVPEFAARVNIQRFHKRIEVLDGTGLGSIYEALSADARRAHGLAPSLWVYDELAQARDRELLDNLMTAMGKRSEPLGVIISTQAPDDDHPLSQIIDDGLSGADPSIYVQIHAAAPEADPFDPETWRACNPAYGHFLDIDDLRQQAERARRIPAFEPAFRNLRLNQRVDGQSEHRLVTAPVWKAGAVAVDLTRLEGRPCFGGLDLSSKHDLTALVLAFPDDEAETGFDILPLFWTPDERLADRQPAERDLFRLWISGGHLISVPGPTIRYRQVAATLRDLGRRYDIQAIGYDRWRIDDFKVELDDLDCGVNLVPFGQGFRDMSPAIEYFAELALTGRLRHGGHPVLTANVAAAVLTPDAAGNHKIDKERSGRRTTRRVDGAVALTMALGVARRGHAAPPPSSPWDDPNFRMKVI